MWTVVGWRIWRAPSGLVLDRVEQRAALQATGGSVERVAPWPAATVRRAADRQRGRPHAHAITLTPLQVAPWGPCCLIQVTDSSRSVSREKVLRRNSDRLNREVMTVSLTRAFSRGFFDQFYQQEFARARRQGGKLALIMVDVDYFKAYNDEYGHPAGDKVLVAVVHALKAALMRSTDKLARYGGEEFAVILPDRARHNAMAIAEHLRAAVLDLKLPHRKSGNAKQITASLGVSAVLPGDARDAADLLNAADLALYAAKKNGRNCVQYHDPQALSTPA